jgi:DNA mismatch repair protein MutS
MTLPEDVTPIRQQYLDIKRQHPDAILFFRLGDFYETFDQDAEITSRELDIVLTSRNVAKGMRIPMAGIPYHAAENYLARLIEKGYHVAICEQVGVQPEKGIFPRQVVRVVTPGTILEPGLLKGDKNNYLASIILLEDKAGIAYVDISTGEFCVTEFSGSDIDNQVRSELNRLRPSEILYPDTMLLPPNMPGHFTRWPAWRFEFSRCQSRLTTHFKTVTLDGFGLKNKPLSIQSAGAVIQYLQETQPAALSLLGAVHVTNLNDYMTLDAATFRNLELTETIRAGEVKGSLLSVLDLTVTGMGKRLIFQWVNKPLLKMDAILERQENIAYLIDNGVLRAGLRSVLKSLGDLERLTNRVCSGQAVPRDLAALRTTLQNLSNIFSLYPQQPSPLDPLLAKIHPCQPELDLLKQAIIEEPPAALQKTGLINPGFSEELDSIIESSSLAREWIANLESIEKQRTGIKTLKVGYNKVFGYFIEITHSGTNLVPPEYIRKQTLVNAERYITPEMKEYETLVLSAEERIHEIEVRLFHQVCTQVSASRNNLLESARSLGELDSLASLAEVATIHGYVRPQFCEKPCLEIHDGRHPVVEGTISGERFVPNDTVFEEGEIVRIITGPNMSGKSTFLRQTALIVLMAQMGSFVPASSARISPVDRIFTRIGAQDEIHAGQSTFMVEMIETANILNHATERSLVVLDEIGRGTSTYDGVSIAWAVVEYIHNHPRLKTRTLFATHYHELTQLSQILPGVRNYNVAVTEADGDVIFLHKIVPGGSDRSYGIHVAQLAGLPRPLIQRASEILKQLEQSSGKAVDLNPLPALQLTLFPETNPLLSEIQDLDINTLSPIEALNKLYEWQNRYRPN